MFLPRKPLHALFLFLGAAIVVACPAARTTGEPAGPAENKLTKASLKARVQEFQKLTFEGEWQKAVSELKTLGPVPALQEKLGELYPETDPSERVAILHILNKIGVEHAVKALPAFAADFAVARPKHPNDLSFAGYFVLEKFMHLAWKKLPGKEHLDVKDVPATNSDKTKPEPVDENKPTKVSPDGFTHTGSLADRTAIRQIIQDKKLHELATKKKTYPVPLAEETDWIRVIGTHAFVRLRGQFSGVDFIFSKSKEGKWSHLADLGQWIN